MRFESHGHLFLLDGGEGHHLLRLGRGGVQEETPSILWYSGSCSSNRVSAITGGENRLRFSPGDQIRRDTCRWLKGGAGRDIIYFVV